MSAQPEKFDGISGAMCPLYCEGLVVADDDVQAHMAAEPGADSEVDGPSETEEAGEGGVRASR